MSIQAIIDRAASDPDFLTRLARDPNGTVEAEGYDVELGELKAALDMPNASEHEIAEALQQRLSHSSGVSASLANTSAG